MVPVGVAGLRDEEEEWTRGGLGRMTAKGGGGLAGMGCGGRREAASAIACKALEGSKEDKVGLLPPLEESRVGSTRDVSPFTWTEALRRALEEKEEEEGDEEDGGEDGEEAVVQTDKRVALTRSGTTIPFEAEDKEGLEEGMA